MKVKELINEAISKKGGKKTKNTDLYLKTIIAIASDDEYVATYIESTNDSGELVTKKESLAPKFRDIIAKAIKKAANLTTEEAEEAAKSFKLSQNDAQTLHDIVTESMYVNVEDCGKKVQLFHKPNMDVAISSIDVKETVRNNPIDPSKETVIAARKKVKAEQKIHAFQKTVRIKK